MGSPVRLRAITILCAVLFTAAACSSDEASRGGDAGAEAEPVQEPAERSPEEDVPSALEAMDAAGLPEPLVDPAEVISGGPPPDGIPPIDEPRFLDTPEVDFLEDDEPVIAVRLGSDARAYPVQVMIWHEIVNDTFDPGPTGDGAVPVTVTYCPLCNSGIAYDRRLGERVLDFGTSGRLYRSALVMYDRQTESLWSHFNGEAIAGVLTGSRLETIPVSTVSWADWRDANPDGLVLSRETGEDRPYGQNPYPGYDDVDVPPFAFEGEADDRLLAKERVLGTGIGSDPTAVVLEELAAVGVVEFDLDGAPVVAWQLAGTASALETFEVADGRDVGATGVFRSELDGMTLTFSRSGEGFSDSETGSSWNVLGEATAGPLAGSRLEPVGHVDTFWFAWAAFSPDTEVIPGS